MTDKQAYYAMYYLLYKYENHYGLGGEYRSFDLGSFLGAMNPLFWADGKPLDPAYKEYWEEILEHLGAEEDVSKEQLLEGIRTFCKKVVDDFDFDLGEAPARLQSITADDPDLEEAVAKAEAKVKNW
jgi:hypothetical protein